MCDRAFDNVANFVDRGVELFLPFEKFPAGWFAVGGSDAGSDLAFVADGVVIAEEFAQTGLAHGLRVGAGLV